MYIPCITCTHTLRICVHRCNCKQRLDSWLAEKEFRPPFSNCAELLEWHEDAFVGRVSYGSPYRAIGSYQGSSSVLGRYFCDKTLGFDITFVKLCENIELLDKLVRIVPELTTSTPQARRQKLRLFNHFEAYRQHEPSKIVSDLDLAGTSLPPLSSPCPSVHACATRACECFWHACSHFLFLIQPQFLSSPPSLPFPRVSLMTAGWRDRRLCHAT